MTTKTNQAKRSNGNGQSTKAKAPKLAAVPVAGDRKAQDARRLEALRVLGEHEFGPSVEAVRGAVLSLFGAEAAMKAEGDNDGAARWGNLLYAASLVHDIIAEDSHPDTNIPRVVEVLTFALMGFEAKRGVDEVPEDYCVNRLLNAIRLYLFSLDQRVNR